MLMAFHFWRVRKAGGLVIPRSSAEEPDDKPVMVPSNPDLLLREAAVALAAIAGVLVLSLLHDSPMAPPPSGPQPQPDKAPWYFAGIQELLMHFHPSFALLIAVALMFGAFYLPYLSYREAPPASGLHRQRPAHGTRRRRGRRRDNTAGRRPRRIRG